MVITLWSHCVRTWQPHTNQESHGRLGREAARFLGELEHAAVESGHVIKTTFVRASHRRMSCAVVRGNTRVYNKAAEHIVRMGGGACLWRNA